MSSTSTMRVGYACVYICVVCEGPEMVELWVWSFTEMESEQMGSVSRGPGREWAGSVEGGEPQSACESPHTEDIPSFPNYRTRKK